MVLIKSGFQLIFWPQCVVVIQPGLEKGSADKIFESYIDISLFKSLLGGHKIELLRRHVKVKTHRSS